MSDQEALLKAYAEILVNGDVAKQMRTVFELKQLGGEAAIDCLAGALTSPSVLLGHEAAYVMGQMQNPHAIPALTAALENASLDPIVRHEAAEALGAICDPQSLEVLDRYADCDIRELAETCQIARDLIRERIERKEKGGENVNTGGYTSVDPAIPAEETDVKLLRAHLLDQQQPLYKRYRAMFALRNLGTDESVMALAEGLQDPSALFQHEIAYIFGQMTHPASVPALKQALSNEGLHAMVRHEAAEALGSFGDEALLEFLRTFQQDGNPIVSQSCDVALDLLDFWADCTHDVQGEATVSEVTVAQ
jgi:deoxyhypusine monooxygenase